MAEIDHNNVPAIPIASRMKGQGGYPKPHIGPTIDDYKNVWQKTVGNSSDDFWRKVRLSLSVVPLVPLSLGHLERP